MALGLWLAGQLVVSLLWAHLPLAHGQVAACQELLDSTGSIPEDCGRAWGITNAANVREYWEVIELRMYWDFHCQIPLPHNRGVPFVSDVMIILPNHTAELVFDGDVNTRWSSNCRSLLGGCAPQSRYVGLDMKDLEGYRAYVEPGLGYAQVNCIEVFQARMQVRSAQEISVIVWLGDPFAVPTPDFVVVSTYDSMMGGGWMRRPAAQHGLWRLWNVEPTVDRWTVAEALWYSDVFCTDLLVGVPISSNAYWPEGCIDERSCELHGPGKLGDGTWDSISQAVEPDPEETWIAGCAETSCEPYEAWIGIDLSFNPTTVQCIRILQPRAESNPNGWIPFTHSSSLYLQEWVGWDWRETIAGIGLWPANPIEGFEPGAWNDTRPTAGAAWHISSPIDLLQSWRVNELLFHEEADCTGLSPTNVAHGLAGLAIHSNPSLPTGLQTQTCNSLVGSCADLAFDRSVATAWESSCSPCGFQEAWIGMKMNLPRTVRCFQLYQDASPSHSTTSVRVLEWNGNDWESRWTEVGFGAGSWNSRPAMQSTMWRIVALTDTALPWTVTDVIPYSDSTCLSRVEDALDVTFISSGSTHPSQVGYAFDDASETDWIAGCVAQSSSSGQGCAPGAAWLGMQAPEPIEVKCVQLYQTRERQRQSFNVSMEYWNGLQWTAEGSDALFGLGGGAWQVLPGSFASMWRLYGVPSFSGAGFAVSELQLYTNPTCSGAPVNSSGLPGSRAKPISSGWATATEVELQTGYRGHYPALGMLGTASPEKAFDQDLDTFWADLGATFDRPGWIGTDFQVQVATIQCVRVAFAPAWHFQAEAAELQVWTGSGWASQTMETGSLPSGQNAWQNKWAMPLLGAVATGWVQRPISARLLWRVQTYVRLRTWVVRELEMHSSPTCESQVHGTAMSSVTTSDGVGHGGHDSPARAFDGDPGTYWEGECFDEGESTVCSVGRMWIGLHLDQPDEVRCIRLYQSGRREFQASSVRLSTWQVDGWQVVASYYGLGGSSWQQRPAPPDSLWRIVYSERRNGCDAASHQRSWGVSELQFFADEDCSDGLPGIDQGAVPIASGTPEWRLYAPAMGTTWSNGVEDAFDGDTGTYWRAHCGTPGGEHEAFCEEGQEWIGLDFSGTQGGRYEVRCFRLLQSREGGSECCDPAAAVDLHRWNGVNWVAASWRHLPYQDSPVHIDANFSGFATCAIDLFQDAAGAVGQSRESTWEERSRREAETCAFEKSEATTLIADPLCEKHDRCAEAGFAGFCCPLRSGKSRCCCTFMKDERIFEDELELDVNLNPKGTEPEVGYEYVVIRSSIVMPWMGLVITAIVYVLGNLQCPQSSTRLQKAWLAMCAPVQAWLKSDTVSGRATSFFVCKIPGESRVARPLKAATWLTLGFFVGGSALWILMAYGMSKAMIAILLFISKIMRHVKSPYDMMNEADKQRMVIVLAIPYAGEPVKIKFDGAAAFAKSLVEGGFLAVTTLIRSIFDAIVLRFAMLSVGLVDIKVSVSGVVEALPKLPSYMPQIFDYLYEITSIAAEAFTEAFLQLFEGVPRCQGPIRIFCSMFMLFITLVYIRFFNYDYFGLFVTSIETAKASRPTFQKTCFVVGLYAAQAIAVISVQCMMLVFARGIVYAVMTVEGSSWNGCPYEEEAMSILVGQVFLYGVAAFAIVTALLCANGHLLGSKFLIKDFEKSVQVHFYDNDGENDTKIRTEFVLSMIPTTLGIWIDGWNVDGFRIKERAHNLAKEMKYPTPCPECGRRHVPYNRIMKASGVQLSLAYQAVPFGALLGKACEYLNNPPLVYIGTSLPCFWENRHLAAAREGLGKKEASRAEKSGLFAAWCKDRLLQVLRRIPGPLIFAALVYFTFAMTEEDMVDMAMELFTVLSCLAACQAFVEIILPTLIIGILVVALVVTKRRAQVESVPDTDELGRPRPKVPLVGFVLHGSMLGMGAFIYMWHEGHSFNVALFPGFLVSLMAGSLVVFLAWFFQVVLGSIGSRFFLGLYGILAGFGSGWLMSTGMTLPIRFTVIICTIGLILPLTVVTLAPHQRKEQARAQVVDIKHGSPLMRLLHTWRFLSGSLGSTLGVFAAAAVYDVAHRNIEGSISWDYVILLLSGVSGLILGVAYSMGVDMMIKTKAGRWALLVGNLLSICIGAVFPWAIGVVVGSVVGCIVGAVLEGFLLRAIKRAQFPLPATSKASFKEVKSRGDESDAYQKQALPVVGGPPPEPPDLVALQDSAPMFALDDAQSRTSDSDSQTAQAQALALVVSAEQTPASSAHDRTKRSPAPPSKKKRYTMGQPRQ